MDEISTFVVLSKLDLSSPWFMCSRLEPMDGNGWIISCWWKLYLVFIAWSRKHGVDLKMIIGALCVRKLWIVCYFQGVESSIEVIAKWFINTEFLDWNIQGICEILSDVLVYYIPLALLCLCLLRISWVKYSFSYA